MSGQLPFAYLLDTSQTLGLYHSVFKEKSSFLLSHWLTFKICFRKIHIMQAWNVAIHKSKENPNNKVDQIQLLAPNMGKTNYANTIEK